MAELKEPLRNCDLVGGCYDILYVDPIDLSSKASKFSKAFDLTEFVNLVAQPASRPKHLKYIPNFGGGQDKIVSELSTSYDFQTYLKQQGSLTVSDPTGELFCATLSASFNSLRKETTTRSVVVTYVSERVNRFDLEVDNDAELSDEMKNALEQLPDSHGTAYKKFIGEFGTHYLKKAVYGGRATQRLSVSTEDYISFLQQGIKLNTQATATLELVQAKVTGGVVDKREQKFINARSLTVGSVVFVDGHTQEYLDMWAMSVENQPMPIEATFTPLYELLTPARLPEADPASLEKRQGLLKTATEGYLASKGADVRPSLLRYGDIIELELVVPGPTRVISSDTAAYVRTVGRQSAAGEPLPQTLRWILVDPSAPGSKEEVKAGGAGGAGRDVVLRSAATGMCLDAAAGSDGGDYRPGSGLAGMVEGDPRKESAYWTLELPDGANRTNLVDGDVVRLRSRYRRRQKVETGYLLGEPDCENAGQRVFAFGVNHQPGAFWAIRRAPVAK